MQDILSLTAFEFENICRTNTSYAYLGNNKALCRILGRYKIFVDTRDIGITPHLVMDGFWETWLTQCLERIIKPGDICIDIGANFGYYSILMSTLTGKNGRTIAIEPNPDIFSLLQATASVHSSRIETAGVALSNVSGRATLSIPDNYYGDASIVDRQDRQHTHKSKIKVKMETLDQIAQEFLLPKIDVIKMDVEGVEPLVFDGMSETIAKNPGLRIVVEYSPFLYTDAKYFTEYLFFHFTVHRIKDVDQVVKLTEADIPALLGLTDHTDLYLVKK